MSTDTNVEIEKKNSLHGSKNTQLKVSFSLNLNNSAWIPAKRNQLRSLGDSKAIRAHSEQKVEKIKTKAILLKKPIKVRSHLIVHFYWGFFFVPPLFLLLLFRLSLCTTFSKKEKKNPNGPQK